MRNFDLLCPPDRGANLLSDQPTFVSCNTITASNEPSDVINVPFFLMPLRQLYRAMRDLSLVASDE